MSFSSQKDVCYHINQFYYYLLNRYMKTSVMLKHQECKNSKSNKIESKVSKRQHLDKRNNKEGNSLDNEEENSLNEDKDEIENSRYILLPFILLFFITTFFLIDLVINVLIINIIKSINYSIKLVKNLYYSYMKG